MRLLGIGLVLVIFVILNATPKIISANRITDKDSKIATKENEKIEKKHKYNHKDDDDDDNDSCEEDSLEDNDPSEEKHRKRDDSSSDSEESDSGSDSEESYSDQDTKKKDDIKCVQIQPFLFRCFYEKTKDEKQPSPKYFSKTVSDKPWPEIPSKDNKTSTKFNITVEEAGTLSNWIKFRLKNNLPQKYFKFPKPKNNADDE